MILQARNLSQQHAGRSVVDITELDLPPGTGTAIVGPNGSGKSTLLRLLAFVETPTGGSLTFEGQPIRTRADRQTARRAVTLVEQHPLLFDATVQSNLRYPLALRRLDPAEIDRRIAVSLEALGAAHLRDRPARTLSGGETQRVALARALALQPRLLLLDEPLSAADRSAAALLAHALEQLLAKGTTVCFTSHQLEDAYRWADRVVALADGRITGVTPENLFRTHLPAGSGSKTVRAGPLELVVVTDHTGPATVLIPPDDIVVSKERFASSARNQFAGKIIRLADDGHGRVALTVDVGTDLIVRITPAALADIGLGLGSDVVLSVKAMAVQVI